MNAPVAVEWKLPHEHDEEQNSETPHVHTSCGVPLLAAVSTTVLGTTAARDSASRAHAKRLSLGQNLGGHVARGADTRVQVFILVFSCPIFCKSKVAHAQHRRDKVVGFFDVVSVESRERRERVAATHLRRRRRCRWALERRPLVVKQSIVELEVSVRYVVLVEKIDDVEKLKEEVASLHLTQAGEPCFQSMRAACPSQLYFIIVVAVASSSSSSSSIFLVPLLSCPANACLPRFD
mmetsp:Transcript_14160/g.35508  ORF Transcript_14160/g.35508 Transcript_14160/m.35508 type:complete len:236 (-) Transcript_14160:651-1358(-)